MTRARTIRDPLWGNVYVDESAAEILDSPEFQRLRRVKQLGVAHLVYPGGVHNRFLHALGVYHLVSRAISILRRDGHLEGLDAGQAEALPLVRLAALLHDVGHYAFSHAMEELGAEAIPADHEENAARFMEAEPIRRVLERYGSDASARIGELIRGTSGHPLQGLISGSLDLDKIDYLRRDSLFCGVPYGAVDVDRLLPALTVAREEEGRPLELAVSEKGISALETLLFSKYQMFRNVYWHHAVRAATVTFVRLIQTAMGAGLLAAEDLPGPSDEEMLLLIERRIERSSLASGRGSGPASAAGRRSDSAVKGRGGDAVAADGRGDAAAEGGRDPASSVGRAAHLLRVLVDRRLPKRVVELTGDQLPDQLSSWPSSRPDLVAAAERRLAAEWGLPEGALMLDYPSYPGMLELNLLFVRKDGEVRRLTTLGERGLIDIPRLGRSLHHSARVLRIFSFEASPPRDPRPVLELIEATAAEVEARLGVPPAPERPGFRS